MLSKQSGILDFVDCRIVVWGRETFAQGHIVGLACICTWDNQGIWQQAFYLCFRADGALKVDVFDKPLQWKKQTNV